MSSVTSRGHDAFELRWLDAENQPEIEFCVSLDHAQTRATEIEAECENHIEFHYYMVATVQESPTKAFEPGRRFGHKPLNSGFLKQLTEKNIDEFRMEAFREFDEYMVKVRGMTPIFPCDEPRCTSNATEHLHYDFPDHEEIVTSEGVMVSFGGERSGNFCETHLGPKKGAAHIPSQLGLCGDAKCQK